MTVFLQQLITGISVGGIYAVIASGYALIYSLLDFSNWAHGEVCMLGAYTAFYAIALGKLPFPLAALAGVCMAALISYGNELIAYHRIRKNGSANMFLIIAAMGLSTTYQNAANLAFGSKFKKFAKLFPVSTIQLGGVFIGVLDLISLAAVAVVIVILFYIIQRTSFGLNVRAITSNGSTANLLGIRVDRTVAMVFLLAGALAGVAGILYGLKYNVYPTMGNVGLKAFVASVLGGLGSVPGAIVGAILLGVIETMVSGYLNSGLRDLISFGLLILILLVKPSGLFGIDVQEKA